MQKQFSLMDVDLREQITRNYLDIDYNDKAIAKACGASFDWDIKQWYTKEDHTIFMKKFGKALIKRDEDIELKRELNFKKLTKN